MRIDLHDQAIAVRASSAWKTRAVRSAFTLVEALAATACVAFVIGSLLAGLAHGFEVVGATRENLRATQILQEQMEGIRLYTWEQITSNGFIAPTFTAPFYAASTQATGGFLYTGQVEIAAAPLTEDYSNDLRLVSVTLSWNRSGIPHQRTMSTLVSRYGLHNYFYDYNP